MSNQSQNKSTSSSSSPKTGASAGGKPESGKSDKSGPTAAPTGTATPSDGKSETKSDGAAATGSGDKPAEGKKSKGPKVRFQSATAPEFTFRVRKSLVDKYGAPSHGGRPMTVVEQKRGGKSTEDREAEKAALANMTDEQKLAYAKQKREAAKAAKEAKKQAERAAFIEYVKSEMAAGRVPV